MSNAIFPTLPGIGWNISRTPMFKNGPPQEAVDGREIRVSYQQYPKYKFNLMFEFLRDGAYTELDAVQGFFLQRNGSFDNFLFTDWSDNAVTDAQFGSGNGGTTQFQLTRAAGGGGFTFTEPVQNVNTLTNIKVAGVTKTLTTDYTINSTGLVTFVTAPASAASLTWSGSFYYRCRFSKDEAEFNNFMKDLWEHKKCELIGAPGNKV